MIPIKTSISNENYFGYDRNRLNVADLKDLGEIKIILVSGWKDPNYAIWKEMIEGHHYLHSAKLYGQQIKYLVKSPEYGWIGALAFSSGAWRLESRDERIGWDDKERNENLNKIVCNSRFLILPEGVKNLASHVMSLSLKRLPEDWERYYNVRPILLETFVDKERYSGACYKASNWTLLGETKGRGRNDRLHENNLSVKYIYAYELEKGVLGEAPQKEEEEDWVREEYRYCKLSNKAKEKRLITLTRDFFDHPASNIPEACGSEAKLKGAYRFFSDDGMELKDILSSHTKQTIERARGYDVVLAVNDTTSFNYKSHEATEGLGCLSSSADEIGFLLHDTVIFTTTGIPLGVLDAQTWARDVKEHGKRKEKRNKAIEDKESCKWLKSLEATANAQREAPEVRFVSVGDRESDIYELFELGKRLGCNFLARSAQNRRTKEGRKIWDLVKEETSAGKMKVRVTGKNKKVREAEF